MFHGLLSPLGLQSILASKDESYQNKKIHQSVSGFHSAESPGDSITRIKFNSNGTSSEGIPDENVCLTGICI